MIVVALGCVSSLVSAAAGSAAAANVTCAGTAPVVVTNDLIVPPGTTCTIGAGSVIGYDVIVQRSAILISDGGRIGHDIHASSPAGIVLFGGTTSDGTYVRGSVGNDLRVDGITGSGAPSTNFVCSTDIVHDVVITNSAATAGEWVVGDAPELCLFGNTVGHDLVVQNNKNPLEISDNSLGASPPYGIGHDLRVTGNALAPVVEGNTVAHDAVCQSNFITDTDNEPPGDIEPPNTAGHINRCR